MAKLRVSTDRLRKGMIITNSVYSSSGMLLVSENTVVTKEILELLTRHFVSYVIAEFPPDNILAKDLEKHKSTAERKSEFQESVQIAEETLSESLMAIASQDKEINVPQLVGVMNGVLEKASDDASLCDMLFWMKKSKGNLYRHVINVSLVGQILAQWLNFTKEEIELVSVAGLLHDIGIMGFKQREQDCDALFFKEVLENKRGKYEKHVLSGYNMIKDKPIDDRIKKAILTHHERIDRTGYPLQVGIENIGIVSRVLAIADTYDILSMQESRENMISPLNVLEWLQELSYNKLDPNMLLTFTEKITQSYIQQKVLLSNGRKGRIVLLNKYNLPRPLISCDNCFINLAEQTDIRIVEFLDRE